jgi:23S rRNA (uracil1939-C5)-methyltransferase
MTEGLVAAIGGSGDGIVRSDGNPVFVPFALTGERVAFDSRQAAKRLDPEMVSLLQPSEDRIAPPCPHHGDIGKRGCGGCRMQHLADPTYRVWKRGLVLEAFGRAGLDLSVLDDLQVSPPRSRRRASLTIERTGKRLVAGFTERGSHRIVDLKTCLILKPELLTLVEPLRRLPIMEDRERADILLTGVCSRMEMVIERKRELSLPEREAIAGFFSDHGLAGVYWKRGPRQQAEPVAQLSPLVAHFGDTDVPLPPGGFLQATEEGERALGEVVEQAVAGCGNILDLFAGAGTFSFRAARHGRVHAVEGDPLAVRAVQSARHHQVTAEIRDLFQDPVTDLRRYDAAIFDPPYAGAKAQAEALAVSAIPVIVGISCNPASFARDAAILVAGGYRLERAVPVDQFLWSAEVEVVGVFKL